MGEIADMMINGLMCESCGEFMEDMDEPGYPRKCAGCGDYATEIRRAKHDPAVKGGHKPANTHGEKQVLVPAFIKVNCPHCNGKVRAIGLADHMRDKHGQQP